MIHNYRRYAGKTYFVPCDLTKEDEIKTFCTNIFNVFPEGIDILVNNAGECMYLMKITVSNNKCHVKALVLKHQKVQQYDRCLITNKRADFPKSSLNQSYIIWQN